MTKTSERSASTEKHVSLVEFSLTDDVKKELRESLDSYIKGEGDISQVGKIVGNALGSDIIKELCEGLTEDNHDSQTVYVIHNLPEINDRKAIELFKNPFVRDRKEGGRTFNHYIMKGVEQQLKLRPSLNETLVRRFKDKGAIGDNYHNHGTRGSKTVAAIGGILSDGSPTNFLNLHQLAQDPEASKLLYSSTPEGAEHSVSELCSRDEWGSRFDNDIYLHNEQKSLVQRVISEYIRPYATKKGDLVLWYDDGVLLHRAVNSKPNNSTHDPDDITRIVNVYDTRPQARG